MVVVSLAFTGIGLLCASLPYLDLLTKALSLLGLLVGGVAFWLAEPGPLAARAPNYAGLALSLFTLVFVGPWPFVAREPPPAAPDLSRLTVVSGSDQGMTPRETVKINEWFDASRGAVQQHDVRVQVTSVSVERVAVTVRGKAMLSPRSALVVRVRIRNTGAFRRIDYQAWPEAGPEAGQSGLSLTDETGRSYRRQVFGPGTMLTGHIERAPLTPGKAAEAVLVFEVPPLARLQELHLELPASAFGGDGTIKFRLPRDMIQVKGRI